jgi:hypothetical protein
MRTRNCFHTLTRKTSCSHPVTHVQRRKRRCLCAAHRLKSHQFAQEKSAHKYLTGFKLRKADRHLGENVVRSKACKSRYRRLQTKTDCKRFSQLKPLCRQETPIQKPKEKEGTRGCRVQYYHKRREQKECHISSENKFYHKSEIHDRKRGSTNKPVH